MRRLPNVPEEKRNFCLLDLVPWRLQRLANFTCLRLESHVFWGAKESGKTYPGCQKLFMHGFRIFVATRAFGLGPKDPATREKKNLWYRGYFIWLSQVN